MELNADFTRRVVVHADELDWVASPQTGVSRRMLERIGDEVARATSIVRYDPASRFPRHLHDAGEEFLVLDGVFQDEDGAYPAGSYVRNPPGSSHAPGSERGCEIFVKLRQFDPDDLLRVRIDTAAATWLADAHDPGVWRIALFQGVREQVRLERWKPGARVRAREHGGAELLVLHGELREGGDHLRRLSWLRLPPHLALDARVGESGAQVWIKTGHLGDAPQRRIPGPGPLDTVAGARP